MWFSLCQNDPCDVLALDLGDIARNPVWLFSDEAEQLLGSGQCYLAYGHVLALFPDLSDHEEIERLSMGIGDCTKPSQVTDVYWYGHVTIEERILLSAWGKLGNGSSWCPVLKSAQRGGLSGGQ